LEYYREGGGFGNLQFRRGKVANLAFFYMSHFAWVILAALVLISLAGCEPTPTKGSDTGIGLKPFNDAILKLRQDDGFLSKENVDSLKKLVLEAKGGRLAKWKDSDGQVNMDSLADYIVKEGIIQNKRNITDPVPESFDVNFFIKNSGNMYGYINPKGTFQEALFGLLADLKSSKQSGNISLNYVNTVVTHSVPYNSDDVAVNYIHKVNLADFVRLGRGNGGDPGETDFDKVFGHILKMVDKNSICILAADFIFSPGKVQDVGDYIKKHSNSIKVKFSNKIDELDLAVLVFRMESNFDGNYWNKKGVGVGRITAQRPYYIWFIGSPQHLAKIIGNKKLMTFLKNNGYTGDNMVFESLGAEKQLEFKIAASEKYSVPIKERNKIKAKKTRDSATFFVDVNFNDAFRDSAFFVNSVKVSDGYALSVKPSKNNRFKHRLTLKSEKLIRGDLKISVEGKIPEWVDKVNSTDDVNIKKDVSEQSKTYGFKDIMEGVYSAFYPTVSMDEPHVLQTLNLNVQLED